MLLPANTGGRIGCFKRLEYLSQKNAILPVCITDCNADV